MKNLTGSIQQKLDRGLHNIPNHPIAIVKNLIYKATGSPVIQDLHYVVNTFDNFDALLIPKNHTSRRPTDTYYVEENLCVRTHTTAHLPSLGKFRDHYVVCGQVARKDTLDAHHYPVFTQMDGYRECENPSEDLIAELEKIIKTLFPNCAYRFKEDYFPFTINSIEAEILYNGKWIEILGGGQVHPDIMKYLKKSHLKAYAYGLGLDRIAMILFDIPDIRLLWSEDERFLNQFTEGVITTYTPFSNHPPCLKDIAFWVPNKKLGNSNQDSLWNDYYNFCELIMEISYGLVENISEIDVYRKEDETSFCYRITYRSHERSLTHTEVNEIQEKIRVAVAKKFKVILR